MTQIDKMALLQRAMSRAATESFFMASALAAYREQQGIDEPALASWLGCSLDELPRLGLCRRPDPDSASFAAEVRQIASYARVQPFRLAQLLREVDASATLQGVAEPGLILAARDREPSQSSGRPRRTRKQGKPESED